jgi:hypothetical protein
MTLQCLDPRLLGLAPQQKFISSLQYEKKFNKRKEKEIKLKIY